MDIDSIMPFQVSTWLEEHAELGPLGKAKWVEMARCPTEFRARKVARGLCEQGELVQISAMQEGSFVAIDWYPDETTVREKTNALLLLKPQ